MLMATSFVKVDRYRERGKNGGEDRISIGTDLLSTIHT